MPCAPRLLYTEPGRPGRTADCNEPEKIPWHTTWTRTHVDECCGEAKLRNQTDSDMKCVRGVQQKETNRGLEGSPENEVRRFGSLEIWGKESWGSVVTHLPQSLAPGELEKPWTHRCENPY